MISELKELSTRLGKRRLLLDRRGPQGKRALLLYDYVRRNDAPNPEGAGAVLSCSPNSIILRKTSDYLERVLLDNILMVRPGEVSSTNPEAVKKYVWKLIGIGAGQLLNFYSKLLLPFLEEAFTLAEEHGLIEAAKTASSYLAIITVTREFDAEKHHFYQTKNDYYESLFLDYQLIRVAMRAIEKGMQVGVPLDETLLQLKRLWAQCLQAEEQHHHPRLVILRRHLKIRSTFIEGNHEETVRLASEAIKWVEQGPEYLKGEETGFILFLSQAYLISNNYENGFPYLNDLLNKKDLPVTTRGKILETSCLLCLRSGEYQKATEILSPLTRWNQRIVTDKLSVFKAYLWLLYKLNKFTVPSSTEERWLYHKSIKGVLDESPQSSFSYFSLHQQIIRLVYYLHAKKYKLAKAALRSLPSPKRKHPRYRLFHKMLELLFVQSLHHVAVKRHTEAILKKLRKHTITAEAITNSEEILAFETIWQLILDQLGNKRIKIN